MTDLTELWQKGELPSGEYWCLSICGDIDKLYCYQNSFWKYKTEDDYYGIPVEIEQVLAPVHTFDEWQASEKYNKHLEEVIKIYEQKDKQATETSIAYNELLEENAKLKESIIKMKDVVLNTETNNMKSIIEIVNIAKENAQLKELLKECKRQFEEVALYRYDVADTDQEDWFKISTEQAGIANKMISKIDEVLK